MLCKLNSSVLADCNTAKNVEAMQRGYSGACTKQNKNRTKEEMNNSLPEL